jgi:hypothetical protein
VSLRIDMLVRPNILNGIICRASYTTTLHFSFHHIQYFLESTMDSSPLKAASLFNINDLVAVVTGGGTSAYNYSSN